MADGIQTLLDQRAALAKSIAVIELPVVTQALQTLTSDSATKLKSDMETVLTQIGDGPAKMQIQNVINILTNVPVLLGSEIQRLQGLTQ